MALDLETRLYKLLFSRAEQQSFLEDLCLLVEDGIPVNQAVSTIHQIAKGPLKPMTKHLLEQIAQGRNVADGLIGWFPPTTVEIIRAGEEGGKLVETIQNASKALAVRGNILSSLLGSLLYPTAVLLLAFAVTVFIRNSVFVNFTQIRPLEEWPTAGKLLYHWATFLQDWWWLILLFILLIVILTVEVLRNVTGPARQLIDRIPLLSLYRLNAAARLMETLGLLISNGLAFKKSLSLLQTSASRYLAWHLLLMEYRLSGGKENIAEVLDTGLIPEADLLRLKAIAKGRGFDHALVRMGKQASDRNEKFVKLVGRIIGGVLLGASAGYAMFMIVSIYEVGSYVGS